MQIAFEVAFLRFKMCFGDSLFDFIIRLLRGKWFNHHTRRRFHAEYYIYTIVRPDHYWNYFRCDAQWQWLFYYMFQSQRMDSLGKAYVLLYGYTVNEKNLKSNSSNSLVSCVDNFILWKGCMTGHNNFDVGNPTATSTLYEEFILRPLRIANPCVMSEW